MSKMSKAIAVLGVVAGLGVAALPLSSYAADGATASTTATVTATVGGAISIEVVEPEDITNASGITLTGSTLNLGEIKVNGAVVEGSMGIRVLGNDAETYNLTIKAPNTADMVGSGTAAGSSIKANANLAPSTAGWAYKVANYNSGNWTALTTSDVAIVTGGSLTEITPAPTGIDAKTHSNTTNVTFGVSADDTTPAGVYTGTVVFTATVQN